MEKWHCEISFIGLFNMDSMVQWKNLWSLFKSYGSSYWIFSSTIHRQKGIFYHEFILIGIVSHVLPPIEGHQTRQHPLFCRLLKRMINQCSLAPWYKTVLECWHSNRVHAVIFVLDRSDLSMKLVMLLALSNASRASDQASPNINFQQFTPKVYVSSS